MCSRCVPMRWEAGGSLGRFREVFIGEGLRRILKLRLERCDARQKWALCTKGRRVINKLPGVVGCCWGVSGCIPMRWGAGGSLGRFREVFIGEGLRRILRWRLECCDVRQKWASCTKGRRVVNKLPGVVGCCSAVSRCIPMRWEAGGSLGRFREVFIEEGLRRILRWRLECCDARQKWALCTKGRRVVNKLPGVVGCCWGVFRCVSMR